LTAWLVHAGAIGSLFVADTGGLCKIYLTTTGFLIFSHFTHH